MRFIYILMFIAWTLPGFSQKYFGFKTYDVDSLLLVLPGQVREERVLTLNFLAKSLSPEEFVLAREYADEAMELATELDFREGIAETYQNFGHIYTFQSNYPDALNNYYESLELYQELDEKYKVAQVYEDIATTHYFARNFEKAIEYGNIALDKYREPLEGGATVGSLKDTLYLLSGMVLVYESIAANYRSKGQTQEHLDLVNKILEMDRKFLEVAKKYDFPSVELVLRYFLIGARFESFSEPDSSRKYFSKALAYPDENQDVAALKYRARRRMGYMHWVAGEIDSAVYCIQSACNFYIENGILFWALMSLRELGLIHYQGGELDKAERFYMEGEKIFEEMHRRNSWFSHDSMKYLVTYGTELYYPMPVLHRKEMMWTYGLSVYKELYQINELKNNIHEAHMYYIAYAEAKDTLNRIRQNRETIEMQTRYETTQIEKQVDFLKKENSFKTYKLNQSRLFMFGLIGLVLLIVILAIILLRQNKLREQQKNLLLQQKLFRSQMNPHFLFNSLSSIHNYIIHEESAKAGQYLSKFSKLVRNILDSSFEEYIPLEDEIHTITNYLDLQKVRYEDKFDYTIDVDEKIETENLMIPPMLAQPMIENAIEHGIKHKKTCGHISIRVILKDDMMIYEVEDDGIGRERAKEILLEQDKNHKSLATDITRERIWVLNKRLKNKISMKVEDLVDDHNEPTGTKVVFEIPVVF